MGAQRRAVVGLLAALLVTSVAVTVVTAAPAAATPVAVGTELLYRAALTNLSADNTGPHVIEITADITITGGPAPLYSGAQPLTIEGNGHLLSGGVAQPILVHNSLASLTVNHLQLSNGVAAGRGGAISALGSVTVTDTTFTNNTGTHGGAIYSGGSVTVTNSTFSYNTASGDPFTVGADGGAIQAAGSVTITGSNFSFNNAGVDDGSGSGGTLGDGGAVEATGSVTVSGSTFRFNNAQVGGAIFGKGPLTATNSTFTSNSARLNGGAARAAGLVTLVHATVAGNLADGGSNLVAIGAGIDSFGSVVALPLGGGANCTSGASAPSAYSYSDDLSCGFDDPTDDQTVGNDPQLLALANNGGSTLTRAPQTTSPLVDAIPDAACDPAVTTDQRGDTRPADGDLDGADDCDIGAVELQPPAVRPDARIRRGTGGLRGDDTYNNLAAQTVNGSAARGRSVTYFASVQNDAAFDDTLAVRGQGSTANVTVVYRDPAGTNITGEVASGNYRTPVLAAGNTHRIKIVVTVRNSAPRNASVARTLTASSTIRPTIRDAVRFVTSRA